MVGTNCLTVVKLPGIVLSGATVSLADRIAAGQYDWCNDDITAERFPLKLQAGPRSLLLVHFDKVMTIAKVEQWAAQNGYELALIDDLLAVGSHPEYRELQRKYPIVALGSSAVVSGSRYVPYLGRFSTYRYLYLGWCVNDWSGRCRFLVRKV